MDEIAQYRETCRKDFVVWQTDSFQLASVELQISVCTDEAELSGLQQTRSDLSELIALMEAEAPAQEQSSSSEPAAAEINCEALDELLGTRCRAPYKGERMQKLHTAIILDYATPTAADGDIALLVLFSHPMCSAMMPCRRFLSGSCALDGACKFSHGFAVSLSQIEEYREPDFEQVRKGSRLLVLSPSSLWELGKVRDIDREHSEMAVVLLGSHAEKRVPFNEAVPLDEDDDPPEPEDEAIDTSAVYDETDRFAELKGSKHGAIAVSDLGNWQGGGFGLRLMQKMGYKLGQGLGRKSDGIVHAIQPRILPKNKSVDYVMQNKHQARFVDGKASARVRNAMQQAKGTELFIFSFLNKQFEAPLSTEAREKQEYDELKTASKQKIVSKLFDSERQLKTLMEQEARLEACIARNKSDPKIVKNAQTQLCEVRSCSCALQLQVRRKITQAKSSHERVTSANNQKQRRTKDLF